MNILLLTDPTCTLSLILIRKLRFTQNRFLLEKYSNVCSKISDAKAD